MSGLPKKQIISKKTIREGSLSDQPYFRASRQDDLVLPTTWARVDFTGSSGLDTNAYPNSTVEGKTSRKKLDWDSTNKVFRFNLDYTSIKEIVFTYAISGGFRPTEVDFRFVIPSGGGAEGNDPIYFPLPDSLGHMNLANIERRDEESGSYQQIIRTTSVVRDHGLGIELRSNQSLAIRRPTLNDAVVEIYSQ